MRVRGFAPLIIAIAGCGGTPAPGSTNECVPPHRMVGDRCLAPGVQDDGCPAGTLGLEDGSCQAAGVPPAMCADGFAPDGNMGCTPILPSEACTAGLMAVPGDSMCRPVMTCPADRWGGIPIDATTEHVDARYRGGASDGSAAQPWTTISDAVVAAAPGAIVAIADGSYVENVLIEDKQVRLWGVCPGLVEIVGTGSARAALDVRGGARGTEVRGLALRGNHLGLSISGSRDVLVESVWAHDAAQPGIAVQSFLGPTSVVIVASLIEENGEIGVYVAGSEVLIEDSVVRRTRPRASDQALGRGVSIQLHCDSTACDPSARASAKVRGSLIEDNREVGLVVTGSDATIEGSVVRRTLPQASDQRFGGGMAFQLACDEGVCDPRTRANATVQSCAVEDNHDVGLLVGGSDVTVVGTIVRGTAPQASNQLFGSGISLQPVCAELGCDPATRTIAVVRSSRIEQNHEVGLLVKGSDATLEGVWVGATFPTAVDQRYGRGVQIQASCSSPACDPAIPASASVRGCVVAQNHDVGLHAARSNATIEGVLVQGTAPRAADGAFGDGVCIDTASATIHATRIVNNDRAGLSNFGAQVVLGASALGCNGFDLEGEPGLDQPFSFQDAGANVCGCPDQAEECIAQSAGLEPPEGVVVP